MDNIIRWKYYKNETFKVKEIRIPHTQDHPFDLKQISKKLDEIITSQKYRIQWIVIGVEPLPIIDLDDFEKISTTLSEHISKLEKIKELRNG